MYIAAVAGTSGPYTLIYFPLLLPRLLIKMEKLNSNPDIFFPRPKIPQPEEGKILIGLLDKAYPRRSWEEMGNICPFLVFMPFIAGFNVLTKWIIR